MPALISDTIKIVPAGTIATTQTWSTSVWMSLGVLGFTLTQAQLDTIATQVAAPFQTWATAIGPTAWAADTSYTNMKVYYYPAGQLKSAAVSLPAVTPVAGSNTGYMPSLISMAVSYRSDTPGRSGRGRSYCPYTAGAVLATHKFNSSSGTNVGTAYRNLLVALNALVFAIPPGGNNKCQVASFSKGLLRTITHISVDDTPDTQHRREDKFLRLPLYAAII